MSSAPCDLKISNKKKEKKGIIRILDIIRKKHLNYRVSYQKIWETSARGAESTKGLHRACN